MFSSSAQYGKLKTNLRLSINRLKLLEKKKTELAQKSRKEIAGYVVDHKEDRARIRVEHIIREDYLVEAYELLEMYCDLVLARFGLIQQMKSLDEGLEEAINSLLWAAPRIQAEVPEFKVISEQLTSKYGKPFAEAARQDQLGKVSQKLMAKLSANAPPKILVEKYMIEITKANGVPFTPDPSVMRDDEVAAAETMLIDFHNQGQRGVGWMYPAVGEGGQPKGPPPPPNNFPGGDGGYNGGGGGGGGMMVQQPPVAPPQQAAFSYPAPNPPNANVGASMPGMPPGPPSYEASQSFEKVPVNPTGAPSAPELPLLPDVPADFPSHPPHIGFAPKPPPPPPANEDKDELDFDDLSRRFEELKKRK